MFKASSQQSSFYLTIALFIFAYSFLSIIVLLFGPSDLFVDAKKIFAHTSEYHLFLNFFDSYGFAGRFYYLFAGFSVVDSSEMDQIRVFNSGYIYLYFLQVFVYLFIVTFLVSKISNSTDRILFIFFALFASLYFNVPSKDFIYLLIIFILWWVNSRLKLLFIYFSLYRSFLLAWFVLSLTISLFLKLSKVWKMFLLLCLFIILISIGDDFPINKPYAYLTSRTGISNFLTDGSYLSFVLNTVINSVRVLIPFELIFIDLTYLAIFIPRLILLFLILRSIQELIKKGKTIDVAVLLAFIVLQGAFEPDHGSALRHSFLLLPIIAYAIKR